MGGGRGGGRFVKKIRSEDTRNVLKAVISSKARSVSGQRLKKGEKKKKVVRSHAVIRARGVSIIQKVMLMLVIATSKPGNGKRKGGGKTLLCVDRVSPFSVTLYSRVGEHVVVTVVTRQCSVTLRRSVSPWLILEVCRRDVPALVSRPEPVVLGGTDVITSLSISLNSLSILYYAASSFLRPPPSFSLSPSSSLLLSRCFLPPSTSLFFVVPSVPPFPSFPSPHLPPSLSDINATV